MPWFSSVANAQDWIYSVRPGDNLWDIAAEVLVPGRTWEDLQSHNSLPNPDLIEPGTRIRVPLAWLKQQPTPATVVSAIGTVERLRDDGEDVVEVSVGDEVFAGDSIRTQAGATAIVEFADRSRLLLQADTIVEFDSLSMHGTTRMVDTSMRLHRGRVESDVQPLENPESRYRIVTPPAVAAVRGTEFRFGYDVSTERAVGEITEGEIGVSAEGVTRAVGAGFGIVTVLGEAPGEPEQLLPAPDVSSLANEVSLASVNFTWPGVPDAVGYRAQLFRTSRAENLLRELVALDPELLWFDLTVGDYHLRLRATAASGLEGLHAGHDFSVLPPAPAPLLLAPIALARTVDATPELRWTVPERAVSFNLQIASDEAFSRLLVDRRNLQDWRYVIASPLPPADYFWRVAGVDRFGIAGDYSAARRFTVLAVPGVPTALKRERRDGRTQLAWSDVEFAQHYRVQLAHDRGFRNLILDTNVSEPRLAFVNRSWGSYYARVTAVSSDGVRGPPSAIHRYHHPALLPHLGVIALLAPLLLIVLFRRR